MFWNCNFCEIHHKLSHMSWRKIWRKSVSFWTWHISIILQPSAVITRLNASRYRILYCDESVRSSIKINLNSQQTPHISPSRASYGVSIVRTLEIIDRIMKTSRCISFMTQFGYVLMDGHWALHWVSWLSRSHDIKLENFRRIVLRLSWVARPVSQKL